MGIFGGFWTGSAVAGWDGAVAETVISAGNEQIFSVHQAIRYFVPGGFVNFRDGGTRYVHLNCTLFMGFLFVVHQTNDFKFVDGKPNRLFFGNTLRGKSVVFRFLADSAAALGSWHQIILLFPLYVDYITENLFCIRGNFAFPLLLDKNSVVKEKSIFGCSGFRLTVMAFKMNEFAEHGAADNQNPADDV